MGLLQGILGNASSRSISDFENEWSSLISVNEEIVQVYKLVRDWIAITDKRLIYIDVQGMTGTKKSIKCVPWHQIVAFEVVSAGIADLNAELYLYVASSPFPLKWKFSSSVNIYQVQQVISEAIVSFSNGQIKQVEVKEEQQEVKQTLDDLDI